MVARPIFDCQKLSALAGDHSPQLAYKTVVGAPLELLRASASISRGEAVGLFVQRLSGERGWSIRETPSGWLELQGNRGRI